MEDSINFPLSSVQRTVLNDYLLGDKVPKYHIGCHINCKFSVDKAEILQVVNEVSLAHKALRMCLVNNKGEYHQFVRNVCDVDLRFIDLSKKNMSQEYAFQRAQEEFDEQYQLERTCWRPIVVKYSIDEFVLCIGFHHLFVDGFSISLVLEDIIELLNGNNVKERPKFDYLNFIESDAKYLNSKRAERDREFWHQEFNNLPPRLYKPKDGSLSKSFPSATKFSSICRGHIESLQHYSEQNGVGLAHSLIALVVIFISKTRALKEVTLGIPVHNRTTAAHKQVVGMFSGLIPLKIELTEDDSFADLAQRVAKKLAKTYRHQKLPISEINSVLKTMSYNRKHIFDVTVSYEPFPSEHKCIKGEYKVSRVAEPYEQMPLAIAILDYHESDDLHFMTNYNTNYFSTSEFGVVEGAIAVMVEFLQGGFDIKVEQLPLLSESDIEEQYCNTSSVPSCFSESTLTAQFNTVASLNPNSVALECERFVYSYRELDIQSTQLAHSLKKEGVVRGDKIGFCLSRSCLSIVAMLGIVKLGAVYVPIDPANPESRIEYLISDSGMKLLITEEEHTSRACLQNIPLLNINELQPNSEASSPFLESSLSGFDPAYIIYTSGSTGKPKGVEVSHHNVLRLFDSCQSEFSFSEQDVWAVSHSLAFDFSVWEIWGALLFGGKLILISEKQLRSPFEFYEIVANKKVTILNQTPSAFLSFDNIDASQNLPLSLRRVVFGGEALSPANLKEWFARHGDISPKLINMYGTTETTVHATYKALSVADSVSKSTSIIGKPLKDLDIQIHDSGGNLLPIGSIGEMVIGGNGVSAGYYGKPELNSIKFYTVSNPNLMRYYRTGDLAKLRSDGELEYIGRIDEQIKLRGYRIELGEIEAQINQIKGISSCVVQLREDVKDQKRVVAYLVRQSSSLEPQEEYLTIVNTHLNRALPSYMVPTAFICLDRFPLTTNGKIDKSLLQPPESYPNWRSICASYVPPSTDLEIKLAQIWAGLLKAEVTSVGKFDDFFLLGGDSLSVMKLISHCNDEFNIMLSFSDVFDNLELNKLSEKVEQLIDDKEQDLSQLVASIDELSEEEIDQMLQSLS
ncbi:non-ribosomal peptide synthetase [Pseudoalteromonas aurantia]|uniref:Carrier domain-containing protein n=1 Tax=Pseudoalteromonas aurantia TaxID=43654 RepID=A0ABY2VYN1_9GAMM|nr:amino acid adenylation domain-containing protein [Pseudoalteromonas aurantia]TMO75132.1 hypothetical protein CWC20_08665 [Pseudoalteromonas aurantia]